MADIFTRMDIVKLLENKEILFVGDQNIRNIYKDFICLFETNELMELDHIARNLEESYLGDTMVLRQGMYKQRNYVERREFKASGTTFEFMFISQCLSNSFVQHLMDIMSYQAKAPDVIYMNSFLWDFNRWGPYPEGKYVESLNSLVQLLKQCLPKTTLFIWATTCPISCKPHDLPFVTQLPIVNATMYSDILEGNYIAAELFRFHGFDVIDNHYHLFKHGDRRSLDGVRYLPCAVRYLTYLLLTHIALTWDHTLPGRIDGTALHEEISRSKEKYSAEKPSNYWVAGEETSNPEIQQKDKNNNTKRKVYGVESEASEEEGEEDVRERTSVNRIPTYSDGYESYYGYQNKEDKAPDDSTPDINSASERKPLLRVKATWEVLQEFGDIVSGNSELSQRPFDLISVNYGKLMENRVNMMIHREHDASDLELITSSENFSDDLDHNKDSWHSEKYLDKENEGNSPNRKLLDPYSVINGSETLFSELEDGEISDTSSHDTSYPRKITDVRGKLNDSKPVNENIDYYDLYKVKNIKGVFEELEEGEIVDEEEGEIIENQFEEKQKLKVSNWEQWKAIQARKAALKMVRWRTEERLRASPDRWYGERRSDSLQIEALIRQIKRRLMPAKQRRNHYNRRKPRLTKEPRRHCSSPSSTNSSLLFGYRKNYRLKQQVSPKKAAETTAEADKTGVSWVADQWKRVIESEDYESREVLSIWQRSVGEIEEQLNREISYLKEELDNSDVLMSSCV